MKQSLGLEVQFDNLCVLSPDANRRLTSARFVGQHTLSLEQEGVFTRDNVDGETELHPIASSLLEHDEIASVSMTEREIRVIHRMPPPSVEARILRGLVDSGYSIFANPR